MKIVFFGNGVRGEKCLECLIQAGKDVVGVVGHTGVTPIIEIAQTYGIPFLQPNAVNGKACETELQAFDADLHILAGYNRILKKNMLNIPRLGTINLHGGRLPYYRGVAPINWQLINGEQRAGFSIIYVDEGIDTGDIIRSVEFPVGVNDTAADLVQRSLEWFPHELLQVVEAFESGNVCARKQDERHAVYYTRRYPEDGQVCWNQMTDVQVHNLVRALVPPYPGAYTYLRKKKVMIARTRLLENEYRGVSGRVQLKHSDGVVVVASNRGLLIESLLKDGNIMPARDVLRIGEKFETIDEVGI